MTVFKRKEKDIYEIIESVDKILRKENEATIYRALKLMEKNLRKARRSKNLELIWAVMTNLDEHLRGYIEGVEEILDED
jgi:hypothetical protein